MILPHMSYCIHVWGKAASIHIKKIHILQKKIVRIISGVRPRTHSLPLFEKLKLMTVYQVYDYYIGVFMYKIYYKQLPLLFNMFERTSDVHGYSTRQYDSFYVNYVPTLRSQRSVKFTGYKLWNVVISKINIHCKIGSYKTNLKKILLANPNFL